MSRENLKLSTRLGAQVKEAVEREIERRGLNDADLADLLGSDESRVRQLFRAPGWGIDPACEVAAALGMVLTLEIEGHDLSYNVPLTSQPRVRPSALAERRLEPRG
jgi:ribosome-binding protein aMBF1 (putative translation factor)